MFCFSITDAGGESTAYPITINVNDVDDELPVFDVTSLAAEFEENQVINSVVQTIIVTDQDADSTPFTFYLTGKVLYAHVYIL